MLRKLAVTASSVQTHPSSLSWLLIKKGTSYCAVKWENVCGTIYFKQEKLTPQKQQQKSKTATMVFKQFAWRFC